MNSYFKEIIFAPKPKPVAKNVPTFERSVYEFDAWVVGLGENKVLYAKCPICNFTYEVENVPNEQLMRKNLQEYEPFYFRKFIRECPNGATHLEQSCQTIISIK